MGCQLSIDRCSIVISNPSALHTTVQGTGQKEERAEIAVNTWTERDTERAQQVWAAYHCQHDISDRIGQTAGIDPVSGQIWFGASAKDIVAQMEAEGVVTPLNLSGSAPTITGGKAATGDCRDRDGQRSANHHAPGSWPDVAGYHRYGL